MEESDKKQDSDDQIARPSSCTVLVAVLAVCAVASLSVPIALFTYGSDGWFWWATPAFLSVAVLVIVNIYIHKNRDTAAATLGLLFVLAVCAAMLMWNIDVGSTNGIIAFGVATALAVIGLIVARSRDRSTL